MELKHHRIPPREMTLSLVIGAAVAIGLIAVSDMPVKWSLFALAAVVFLSATLIVSDREKLFLYCALFFCPYA